MNATTHRRIVIGDVHGNYQGLMQLLEAIAPGSDDQIYFLGDLIDRGPQGSDVVEFVRRSPYPCILGNHEQMLIDSFPNGHLSLPALRAWIYSGGGTTIQSYGSNLELLVEHVNWFRTLPVYLDLGDVWLVHAGVHPQLPLEAQTLQEFCWIRAEFHCMPKPYFPDKLIITGHTITFTFPGVKPGELVQGQGWLDIDTGAYHPKSGWLTGFDIDRRLVYQVNIYNPGTRILPLDEVVAKIPLEQVRARYQTLHS